MSLVTLPKIDKSTATQLLRRLREMAPHYTSEWPAKDDNDPGVGLLKIFSFLTDGVIQRLNRAPKRNFLCFLDMLGIRLLPKTPARVPVRFIVATGTTEPVLVNTATQVSAAATAQHGELPFETTQELLAVPASLKALFAVDPFKDVILKPPPGFLELQKAATTAPPYQVAAFSSAGSKAFQLDRTDESKKGDFLRIRSQSMGSTPLQCCSPGEPPSAAIADHLIVDDLKGQIVFVTEPFQRDYAEGTVVEKMTRFDLLNGKNFQEHILFIGHADLFNVKSEAQFELEVELASRGASNLDPLRIDWEFFGVTETNKEDGWQHLTLQLDGTSGFSVNGRIQLTKPVGEIKEKPINGIKNRWIRARLIDVIPATPAKPVPRIESVKLRVSSAAVGIPADLAFNNDTPLPVNLSFHPFGLEPRIFDRFYLGSKEAFSKPGAEIVIDATLDVPDLLASPAVVFQTSLLRAFAHGAAGRLVEFQIDPTGAVPDHVEDHRKPPDTRITAETIPAAVVSGSRLGVFIRTDDKRIYCRYLIENSPAASQWIDLGSPQDAELDFNPAAVQEAGLWRVYATAGGRIHFSRVVDPNSPLGTPQWTALSSTRNITVASSPFVITREWIFATDNSGDVYRYNGSDWVPLGVKAAEHSRPCAVLVAATNEAKVFIRDPRGDLIYLNTGQFAPTLPSPDVPLVSDPAVVETGHGLRVYARGQDDRLWSINPDDTDPVWVSTTRPSEMKLAGVPFPILSQASKNRTLLSVFSTTNKNQLVELRDDFGVHRGLLQAGPRDLILLHDEMDLSKIPLYIRIVDGPGEGDVRKIVDPNNHNLTRLALLENPLSEVSTEDTEYDLLQELTEGKLAKVDPDSAKLDNVNGTAADDYILVGEQLRQILSVAGSVVKLTSDWNPTPVPNDPYVVLRNLGVSAHAKAGADKLVVLAASASSQNDTYKGMSIGILIGPGLQVSRTISEYGGAKRLAEVNISFSDPLPTKGSSYEITPADSVEGWLQYRDPIQTELRPEISWEYWNGTGWVSLRVDEDTTERFLVTGKVSFRLPENIASTEVAGQDNFWIRARIVGGDYGRELFFFNQKTNQLEIKKDPIRPPKITHLAINYSFTEDISPQACITLNNLSYLDQTAANITEDKYFYPFQPIPDSKQAVYFGFDTPFRGGPVRIYAAAQELAIDDRNKPKFDWTFAADNQWKPVLVEDKTNAFTRPDIITWTIPGDFQKQVRFGQELHWVRAVLEEGAWSNSPSLSGLFLNTVMTHQASTFLNEIVGSSNGTKNQTFQFAKVPVLENEVIRVREVLTEEETAQLIADAGKDVIFEIKDLAGRVLESWVRWREVIEFFDSEPGSRHYRLDRASGELQFGDDVHGKIPPAGGDNIQAFSYQSGGGAAGNVRAGEIQSLVTSVAGIDSVINPVDAGGGSEQATSEQMMEIGSAQISNRGRAVTPEDFEWLAMEASREVRKARCVANRNAQGRRESGWVSLYIVPDSTAPLPQPSLELRRSVTRYLSQRADLNIVSQDHIFVGAPRYVPIGVRVTVFARSLDETATAELQVRKKLAEFLHPLTGGPNGTGWDFGRDLAASDIYMLLEGIDEVDHLGPLVLLFDGKESALQAEIDANALVAAGEMTITVESGR